MVQEVWFIDISHLELRQPLCSMEQNYLCNFGKKHSCQLILKLDKSFKEKNYGWMTDEDLSQ